MEMLFVVMLLLFLNTFYAVVKTNAASPVYSLKNTSVQLNCTHRATSIHRLGWSYSAHYPTLVWTAYTLNNSLTNKVDAYPRFNVTGEFRSGEYNLILNNLKQEDTGYYRCYLFGTNTETVHQLVIVVGPSRVTIQKTGDKLLGTEGQKFQINCSAVGGVPAPDVQIVRSGSIVSSNKQMAAFSIPQLQRSDDGQDVICRAGYEQMNSFPLSDSASIYLSLKPLKPTLHPRSVSVIEGHSLDIMCTSNGSRPAAVFTWDIGGVNITSSSVITSSTEDQSTYTVISRLRFTLSKNHNKQNLNCKAINIAAPYGVPALPINVNVKYPPTVTLDDEKFTEKETPIILTCKADGNPTEYAFYEWTHKSLQGTVIRILNGTSDGTLTLPYVNQTLRYQDAGNYTCSVSNGIPVTATRRSGSGVLTINAPPVFTLQNIRKQGREVRKAFNISAFVYSTPNPSKYIWYRGSTPVTGTGYKESSLETTVTLMFHGIEVLVSGFKFTLTIVEVKESDFTTYKLQVYNSRGNTAQTIKFEPSNAPDPPKNLGIVDLTPHSITVQWEAGYDGGHEQTFYILYKQQYTGVWTTLAGPKGVRGETNQLHETEIKGLQHSTKYKIKMFAQNMINKSDETMVQIAVTEAKVEENKAYTLTGVAAGLSVITVISLLINAVFVYRYLTGRRKHKRTTNRSNPADLMQTPEFYDNITDSQEQNPAKDGSNYTTLEIKDKLNVYEALSQSRKEHNADVGERSYETLGAQDKPTVYEALGRSAEGKSVIISEGIRRLVSKEKVICCPILGITIPKLKRSDLLLR